MLMTKVFQSLLVFFLVLTVTSCGPRSLEDYREEGAGITRSLIKELTATRSREELLQAAPNLKKQFERLVDVMIAAREFREKHPKAESLELTKIDHELSDQLRCELNRLYALEGGREIIEKCQETALHRLDAFEQRLAKQKKL